MASSDRNCFAGGCAPPDRAIDMAETILDRHDLRTAGLLVQFGARQTRKEEGGPAVDEMAAIEFGRDLHRQVEIAPGLLQGLALGRGAHKIAAEAEEGPH